MYDADPNVYFGIPLWVFVFLIAVLATFAFWLKILPYVSALSEARSETRRDHRVRRLWVAAVAMLGQRRRLDEPVLGVADLLILWAFLVHMVFFFWDLVRATWVEVLYAILPEMPLPFAAEFTAVRLGLGLSAAIGLTAIVVATTARWVSRSARARSARIPVVTYGLLAVVFLSSVTGAVYRSGNDPVTEGAWWIQMLATAGFIAWLPFSRDEHVLFAPVSVLTTSLQRSKVPPPSALTGDRVEFTWRELLGGLACADCHRCEQVCAAHARGESSPRDLMQSLKMSLEESDSGHMLLTTSVSPEQIWACDTCAACMQVCPSFNEHVQLIIEMRRRLVSMGITPEPLQRALSSLRVRQFFRCAA